MPDSASLQVFAEHGCCKFFNVSYTAYDLKADAVKYLPLIQSHNKNFVKSTKKAKSGTKFWKTGRKHPKNLRDTLTAWASDVCSWFFSACIKWPKVPWSVTFFGPVTRNLWRLRRFSIQLDSFKTIPCRHRCIIFLEILAADSIFILTSCSSFISVKNGNVFVPCKNVYVRVILGQREWKVLYDTLKKLNLGKQPLLLRYCARIGNPACWIYRVGKRKCDLKAGSLPYMNDHEEFRGCCSDILGRPVPLAYILQCFMTRCSRHIICT